MLCHTWLFHNKIYMENEKKRAEVFNSIKRCGVYILHELVVMCVMVASRGYHNFNNEYTHNH
jgi:hypothetical protein